MKENKAEKSIAVIDEQSALQKSMLERAKVEQATIDANEERKRLNTHRLKEMCERDREKVKGIFHNYECQGGTVMFPFKAYKWDEVQNYTFVDGKVYEIPLGVARHLNKNCWYPLHENVLDKDGKPMIRVTEKKRRFGFENLSFMDPADIGESAGSDIVTVSAI